MALEVVVVLSLCSRLVAPINDVQVTGFLTWNQEVVLTSLVGVVILFVTIIALKARIALRGPLESDPEP
jgi:hypothetical protein